MRTWILASSSPNRFRIPLPEGLARLGGSLRRLIDTALRLAPDPDLGETLHAAADWVDRLEQQLRPSRRDGVVWADASAPAPGRQRPFYVQGAGVGPHHPTVPEPRFESASRTTRGRVRFGVVHEGPPGCAHGGYVALLFDQVLGEHCRVFGSGGMTGKLSVRYRRPTPLDSELSFEASTRRRGQGWTLIRAELRDAQGQLASAEGLFVRRSARR